MRKTNFDKSYERYLQYFEEDRKKGIPTKEPLSRSKYESFYKMQVNNNWASENERKNMPRAIYRETGRVTRPGTVTAARTMIKEAKDLLSQKQAAGGQLTQQEEELMRTSTSQRNLLQQGAKYMEVLIEMFGREDVERVVSP